MADQNDRNSVVLEGIYKGLNGKIDEVKQSLTKEMQLSAMQQASSYEALEKSFKSSLDALMAEIRYLSQQNSAIYDFNKMDRTNASEEIKRAVDERAAQLEKATNERLDHVMDELNARIELQVGGLREELLRAVARIGGVSAEEVREQKPAEIDYDLLADKLAEKLKAPDFDYDKIAERVIIPELDYDELAGKIKPADADYDKIAEQVKAAVSEADFSAVTDKIDELAEKISVPELDYDKIAAHVKSAEVDYDAIADRIKAPEVDYDTIAARVKAVLPATVAAGVAANPEGGYEAMEIDYDLLAEKIAIIIPEVDYEAIADRVVSVMPQTDENLLADRIAAVLPQTDETAIADKVADAIPLVDYDIIADRVRETLENEFDVTVDEAGIEKIAEAVAEGLNYEKIAETVTHSVNSEEIAEKVAEILKEQGIVGKQVVQVVTAPASYEEGTEEPDETAVASSYKQGITPSKKAIPTVKSAPSVADAAEQEPELTTRYKRSFLARIIQSDDETKNYYGELKNTLMSYPKTHSQVNWSNDRFSYAGETVAKIGINGRTLCLYVALDPEEFPTTVYHQKFEGDKKMYEKTPMMVKIKSEVALKRALRLIALLMERNGAVMGDKKSVNYTQLYFFKSDDELLEEGLIKTSMMVKSDLDF